MKQLWLALLLLLALLPIAPTSAAPRCFPEAPVIGDCVDGRIGAFWAEHGGLPVFGYPISGQFSQQVEGRAVEIQLFERNRLELHPANAPPYDVLLGRLGAEMLKEFPGQVMFGTDGARGAYWKAYDGAPGLDWLLLGFSDALRRLGTAQELLDRAFVETPARAFSFT